MLGRKCAVEPLSAAPILKLYGLGNAMTVKKIGLVQWYYRGFDVKENLDLILTRWDFSFPFRSVSPFCDKKDAMIAVTYPS